MSVSVKILHYLHFYASIEVLICVYLFIKERVNTHLDFLSSLLFSEPVDTSAVSTSCVGICHKPAVGVTTISILAIFVPNQYVVQNELVKCVKRIHVILQIST